MARPLDPPPLRSILSQPDGMASPSWARWFEQLRSTQAAIAGGGGVDPADFAALQADVTGLTAIVTGHSATLTSHSSELAADDTRLDSLEASRTTDEADIASLLASRTTDEARITSLESSRTTDETRLDALEAIGLTMGKVVAQSMGYAMP